ncbi:hypothetical protein HanXRQr2_Chr08g0327051 [Helianthus annuus]|uniref:Uncharacterized protein n=1 Tax=Helianthus annuus TaxID=4232 RepID=A0A9K3NBQ7_HELAN|nr:hypothetical protein HanXRQr2_Chr08g0327051 [Helianthus annuus]
MKYIKPTKSNGTSLTSSFGSLATQSRELPLPYSTPDKTIHIIKSKLQVLSFMFTSNFRRCPLGQNLTGGVLYVSKSCTFCPLGQTQLDFFVKSGHVHCT